MIEQENELDVQMPRTQSTVRQFFTGRRMSSVSNFHYGTCERAWLYNHQSYCDGVNRTPFTSHQPRFRAVRQVSRREFLNFRIRYFRFRLRDIGEWFRGQRKRIFAVVMSVLLFLTLFIGISLTAIGIIENNFSYVLIGIGYTIIIGSWNTMIVMDIFGYWDRTPELYQRRPFSYEYNLQPTRRPRESDGLTLADDDELGW